MAERVSLSEAIEYVRAELAENIKIGHNHPDVHFEYTEVELELQIAVTREVSGEAGLNVWVVDAKGGGSHTDARTNRIKLLLKPLDPVTHEVLVITGKPPQRLHGH